MTSTRTGAKKVLNSAPFSLRCTSELVLRLAKSTSGQDLIEYALMAGFVAVAAGAIMPGVASQISVIFSKVSSSLSAAGG